MPKNRVSVQIEGRNYVVITPEPREYVFSVADEVIQGIRDAAQTGRHFDTRDCAVLAALNFCDDRNKAQKRNSDIVDKADQIIRQSGELSKQCREYKDKLAQAINENTQLSKKVKALEEQLADLARELEQAKRGDTSAAEEERQFDKRVQDTVTKNMMGYVPMRQYSLFEDEAQSDGTPLPAEQSTPEDAPEETGEQEEMREDSQPAQNAAVYPERNKKKNKKKKR